MAGLLSVRTRKAVRTRTGGGSEADRRRSARAPVTGWTGPAKRLDGARERYAEALFVRGAGAARGAPYVLLVCGRAPGRALSSGRSGSVSMGAAWVGPLHRTQWAGGHCRLIPRRRRTGPGGERRLPDCASAVQVETGPGCPGVPGGVREDPWNEVGRKRTSVVASWPVRGFNLP
ncbi:hypothetical protein GCM10015535_66480 [Streptomyces gelaticus]|uniref:Uncharacterized protein n=1 Tax=Streptomyces gelaticus TaxID=285446 RepID=A0ABQ2WB53_9ACTN|nr:hypothetical protein GCM10015535_66480 [Streptomyces gelaticus]